MKMFCQNFKKQLSLGSKEAQFYLAQLYFNGWGIEPDYENG
jgi:TPR repeat protein